MCSAGHPEAARPRRKATYVGAVLELFPDTGIVKEAMQNPPK